MLDDNKKKEIIDMTLNVINLLEKIENKIQPGMGYRDGRLTVWTGEHEKERGILTDVRLKLMNVIIGIKRNEAADD